MDGVELSDGYHTFDELYEHRRVLFFALCKMLKDSHLVWKSKTHADGTMDDEVFIMGIDIEPGSQITYHYKREYWDEADFAKTLESAPAWDGHTASDVLERIKALG